VSTNLDDLYRREWAIVVASLARSFGDLDLAEDSAAEALAAAVERWPSDGVPTNPGAWLMTVARNKALDRLRRESTASTVRRWRTRPCCNDRRRQCRAGQWLTTGYDCCSLAATRRSDPTPRSR
jgi:predicted RNA polymerase sigma factor